MQRKVAYLLLCLHVYSLYATCELQNPKYVTNSLFGFLHTILPKNNLKLEELVFFQNTHPSTTTLLNHAFYGITDNLTIIPTIPIIHRKTEEGDGKSTGLGTVSFQCNYKWYQYEKNDVRYRLLSTISPGAPTATVTSVTVFNIKPANVFLGIMQDVMTPHWFFFTDFGGIVVAKRKEYKIHNFLLYAAGLGRNFCTGDHYLTIIGELLGVYQKPSSFMHSMIPMKAGGNFAYFGPSLRYFYKTFFLHAGILATIAFKSPGERPSNYLAGFAASYYF